MFSLGEILKKASFFVGIKQLHLQEKALSLFRNHRKDIEMEEYKDKRNDADSAWEEVKRLRRKFLSYKEAELVYSMQHRKLMDLADRAGALYRIDGVVLINRDIFDVFLESFRQPPKSKGQANHPKNRYEIKKEKASGKSE